MALEDCSKQKSCKKCCDTCKATKKKAVLNLKQQCDDLNEKITGIQELTKTRWDGIDKVIDIFKTGILLLIFLNLAILFFVVVL